MIRWWKQQGEGVRLWLVTALVFAGGALAGAGTAYISKAGDTVYGQLLFTGQRTFPLRLQPHTATGTRGICMGGGAAVDTCSTGGSIFYNAATGIMAVGTVSSVVFSSSVATQTNAGFTSANTGSVVGFQANTGPAVASTGDTAANVQAKTCSGGCSIFDVTGARWRDYEGGNWNYRVTVNPDGGTPLIAPVAETAAQIEAMTNTTVGLAVASDRSPFGKRLMFGNGDRFVQVGGGTQWALEARTLTINPFHESAVCPRCLECTPTAVGAIDGQTCTDAAAGGTAVIDGADFRTFVTAASAASTSTWTSRVAETRRNQAPHLVFQGMTTGTATRRVWYGLSSVALTSKTPTGHLAALRYDTSGAPADTTWNFCTGDGSTTSCTDTGVTVTASRRYALEIDCRDSAGAKCIATVQRVGLAPVTIEKTTNLPGTSTNMLIRHHCETHAASAVTCGIGPSVLETL